MKKNIEEDIPLDFISSLEKYLLVRTKLAYNVDAPRYNSNKTRFLLKSNFSHPRGKDKDIKTEGIKEMISYLRGDKIKYTYDLYFLNVFENNLKEADIHGQEIYKSIFSEILALNPTEDDLFNIYVKLGDKSSAENIINYLKMIHSKELRMRIIKHGFDYGGGSNVMITLFSYLVRFNLSDEELNTVLSQYITNSISLKESTESIVKTLSKITRNKELIEYWVKEINQEEYTIELFEEKNLYKIEVLESALLYRYPRIKKEWFSYWIDHLIDKINANKSLVKQDNNMDNIIYKNQTNHDDKSIHSIIIENKPEMINEVKNIIILFLDTVYEMSDEEKDEIKKSTFKKENFEQLILNARLKAELPVNTITKTNKI